MRFIWTKDLCQSIALKYTKRIDFFNNDPNAYKAACRKEWIQEICFHMPEIVKPVGYWTYENCKKEALKYTTKKDFYYACMTGYNYARKNKWLDEITTHFTPHGNLYKRLIYVYTFSDKSVYIGLTYNFNERHKDHMKNKKSPVYKHIEETKLYPQHKLLTEYIEAKEAQTLEKNYIEEYKKNGYNVLNKAKAGALGGRKIKWNYKKCKKEALKYKTRNEFCVNSHSAYNTAREKKWLKRICKHMKYVNKPSGYWTYENCKNAAALCKNKEVFYKNYGGAFGASKLNNWMDEFFPKNKTK